jgi:hypothetical protein
MKKIAPPSGHVVKNSGKDLALKIGTITMTTTTTMTSTTLRLYEFLRNQALDIAARVFCNCRFGRIDGGIEAGSSPPQAGRNGPSGYAPTGMQSPASTRVSALVGGQALRSSTNTNTLEVWKPKASLAWPCGLGRITEAT